MSGRSRRVQSGLPDGVREPEFEGPEEVLQEGRKDNRDWVGSGVQVRRLVPTRPVTRVSLLAPRSLEEKDRVEFVREGRR